VDGTEWHAGLPVVVGNKGVAKEKKAVCGEVAVRCGHREYWQGMELLLGKWVGKIRKHYIKYYHRLKRPAKGFLGWVSSSVRENTGFRAIAGSFRLR
jgi:hypothetical protein